MAVEIQVTVDDQEVKNLLARLQARMGNLTPVMRTIGEIVRESVVRNFEEERSPDGKRWQPSIRAILTGGKTLTDRAILRNSVNVRPSRDRVSVGTNVVYAAIHQLGGKAGRGHKVNIKARPFLGVRKDDWIEIKSAILAYLTR
jgi:phage virion morphogenesis protein